MSFPDAIRSGLRQYATFSGRASRSEYWWFYLFTVLVSMVTGVIDAAIGHPIFGNLTSLALLLPSLAVAARRLHDSGLSAWWVLVPIGVAVVGVISLVVGIVSFFAFDSGGRVIVGVVAMGFGFLCVLASWVTTIVLLVRKGTPGPNRFGPNPLGAPGAGYPGYPGYPGGSVPMSGYGPGYGVPQDGPPDGPQS